MVLSVIFYATILLGAMAILSIFGFDMRALAASAGIAGAALVFISQNVILDWINGVFILWSDSSASAIMCGSANIPAKSRASPSVTP